MFIDDVDVSDGDGSAGVSSGDVAFPVFPTVPDMAETALEWYSPAPDAVSAEIFAADTDVLAQLQEISSRLSDIMFAAVVLCFFAGFAAGISLIKCFFVWRG